jgi:hypothetical protein
VVAGLAGHVLDEALDTQLDGAARRCGVMRTDAVQRRTTVLLCRFRCSSSPSDVARRP